MPIWLGVGSLVLGGIGAINQNKAAKKAATQQVQSADQGLALQKQIYDEQKAGMQPYAQFGQQALGSLGSLMGFPALPPPNANAVGRDAQGNPLGPIFANQPPLNMSDPAVQHLAQGGSLVDRPQSTYGQGTIGNLVAQPQGRLKSAYSGRNS